MSSLFSQLGGNPFNTAVGQRIEQATDGSLASENWALNMEICDIINETDEGPKEALRAIRKRLVQNAGKNYTVVMYSLIVLETCVKNCGKRFQLLVTQKDFIQDLVKLIGPKNDPPTAVQEKVLSLIQSWAEAFRSNSEMQGVVQIYMDLKQKGIEFPPSDLDTMAPIHTPSRTVAVPPPTQPDIQENLPQDRECPNVVLNIHPQQLEKLRKELDVVQGNMKVFGEMLTELTPGKEHQSDRELLWDLCKTCQNMQSRIVELLDKVGNEKITGDLLQVNDELNNLFLRYERFERKRAAVTQSDLQQTVEEPKPLIDLEENDVISNCPSQQLGSLNLSATGVSSASDKNAFVDDPSEFGADEFDMLAQSRTLEYKKTQNISNETRSDQAVPDIVRTQDFQREQDFEEIQRWLHEQPEELQAEIQANKEKFDRFLAARAAAAERLPTVISTPQNTSSAVDKEKDENKPLSPLLS